MRDKVVKNHNKLELLKMCVWSYHEIMEYTGKGQTTCINLKNKAVSNFGGKVKYNSTMVRVDAFMEMLGTTREHEIEMLKTAEGCSENELQNA